MDLVTLRCQRERCAGASPFALPSRTSGLADLRASDVDVRHKTIIEPQRIDAHYGDDVPYRVTTVHVRDADPSGGVHSIIVSLSRRRLLPRPRLAPHLNTNHNIA
jgi:hypothetical protein